MNLRSYLRLLIYYNQRIEQEFNIFVFSQFYPRFLKQPVKFNQRLIRHRIFRKRDLRGINGFEINEI